MCVAAGKHLSEGPRLFTGSNDTQLLSHSVPQYLKVRPVLSVCGGLQHEHTERRSF